MLLILLAIIVGCMHLIYMTDIPLMAITAAMIVLIAGEFSVELQLAVYSNVSGGLYQQDFHIFFSKIVDEIFSKALDLFSVRL